MKLGLFYRHSTAHRTVFKPNLSFRVHFFSNFGENRNFTQNYSFCTIIRKVTNVSCEASIENKIVKPSYCFEGDRPRDEQPCSDSSCVQSASLNSELILTQIIFFLYSIDFFQLIFTLVCWPMVQVFEMPSMGNSKENVDLLEKQPRSGRWFV